ncbi:MAG TPA: hypothetical protein VFT40_08440 [Sphingomicrobium sp.]|nr:hypothetical protein [Sphingomicrobium sp.]
MIVAWDSFKRAGGSGSGTPSQHGRVPDPVGRGVDIRPEAVIEH